MATIGIRLRELVRLKAGLAVTCVLASFAAVASTFSVSLIPPGLATRAALPAGAHTQVLVDDTRVSVLNAGFDNKSVGDLHQGTVLAGSIMVQDPVREYIAQRANVPVTAIAFSDPQVPVDPPIPQQTPVSQYSLTVAARPTVSILDVYAQAPTAAAARTLVDASVIGLSKYLAGRGHFGLRVTELGHGADVNTGSGSGLTSALVSFLGVFAIGCTLTVLISRARRAWPDARQAAEPASS